MRSATIGMLAVVALLGGCATMSESECLTVDWQTVGFEDGVAGYSGDRIGQHRKACAKHGVSPDLVGYQRGREAGLREYCQPANGFRVGSHGGSYAGIYRIYRDWWGPILLLGIVVFVPLGLLDALAAQVDVDSLHIDSAVKVLAIAAAAGAVTTTGLLGEVFFAGAMSLSLTHPEGERPPPLTHLARRISYWRLILLDIAYVVIVAVGLILFLVPGVLAFVFFGLSGPAVELEDRNVRGALARSYRLVRADFWLVF